MVKFFCVFIFSCISYFSYAAIPNNKNQARNIIEKSGALYGGVAGVGFSLLKINKNLFSSSHIERWVVDIGDIKGRINKGLPGYYHVQLSQNPPRLIIDFSQMPVSMFSEKDLNRIIHGSVIVKSGKLLSDPTDKTLTMILELNHQSKVKVMQVKGIKDTSKLVLDMLL